MQYAVEVRNAKLDAIEQEIGSSPVLRILSGRMPMSCGSQEEGVVLAQVNLPPDWMSAADDGMKSMKGTWRTQSAAAGGTPTHFRIYASGRCKIQGTAGKREDSEMRLNRDVLAAGQVFEVEQFTIVDNNG